MPHGKTGRSKSLGLVELSLNAGSILYNFGKLLKLSESHLIVKASKRLPWTVEKFQ